MSIEFRPTDILLFGPCEGVIGDASISKIVRLVLLKLDSQLKEHLFDAVSYGKFQEGRVDVKFKPHVDSSEVLEMVASAVTLATANQIPVSTRERTLGDDDGLGGVKKDPKTGPKAPPPTLSVAHPAPELIEAGQRSPWEKPDHWWDPSRGNGKDSAAAHLG